jgi:hypothetical protein
MTGELISLFDATQPASNPATSQAMALPAPAGWPLPPADEAFHGLPGAIVAKIAPNTEADPVAILTQLLISFGTAVGRGAYFEIEATRHHPHQFLLLVGESSRARKGTAWDHVRRVICQADPTLHARILTGLSSGEGLVWAVRDPAGSDPGVPDRRLLVLEPEFVSVLKSAAREISTLSPTLRSAWDGRPLQLLTRTAPARSTDAHISLIGHITQAELRHHLTQVELANGLANRFLLCACRRTRLLPEGGQSDPLHRTGLTKLLGGAIQHTRAAGRLRLDEQARDLWRHAYTQFATAHPAGIAGALCARSEAHTIRLALLYALADGQQTIKAEHLQAALALWDYTARSAT